jgi:hypothetical protein
LFFGLAACELLIHGNAADTKLLIELSLLGVSGISIASTRRPGK